jgi:hypothetical protein
MPIRALCCCTYRTGFTTPWDDTHHSASKFIKCIKGEPVHGWGSVPVRGRYQVIDERTTPAEAARLLGELAMALFDDVLPRAPLVVIPVPHSACASSVPEAPPPRARALADALVEAAPHRDMTVIDVLRWRTPVVPARRGGPREPAVLYPNMHMLPASLPDRLVVLIDDVLTTGGRLQTCAAVIRGAGVDVRWAVCAGRTDYGPFGDNAFTPRTEDVSDYQP